MTDIIDIISEKEEGIHSQSYFNSLVKELYSGYTTTYNRE